MGTRRRITFDTVREIGEQLPGTEVGAAYGSPALKVNGRMYACIPVNKQAEPNSLGVYVADFEQRDALLAEDPGTYYVKPHYEPHPIILVRLAQVTRDALEDLLRGAHRVVGSGAPAKRGATKRRQQGVKAARRAR
jgi:hypothetical protein